jgi:signal transduction histidine kinase/ActR/RegA family two-component response regulator
MPLAPGSQPDAGQGRAYYNAPAVAQPYLRGSLVPRISAFAAIVAGALVLIGWQFDITWLEQPMPTASAMMATTALTFVAAGISLHLLSSKRSLPIAAVVGAAIGVMGLLSLGHVPFGQDFAIDRLWLGAPAQPKRMSPLTAVCFAAIGPALAIIALRGRAWIAQLLALMASFVATMVFIGYVYKVSELISGGEYTTMAPHTAVLILTVCVGILFLEPRAGIMEVMTRDTLGGKMVRRTLPATIGIPIALGWLRLAGERAGLYDARVGPPLIIMGSIILVSSVIWLNAKLLDQVDDKRYEAEDELRKANEALEVRVAQKTAALRATEDRLRAGQRMEAMGQLAGGVAHDFNNMMTVVSGYSDLLLAQLPPEHAWRKSVDEIKKAGDRCARLTSHLLAFSRKQILTPSVLDLNAVVNDLCNMLPVLIGEDVSIVTRTSPGLWSVRADAAQIEQVIVNLAVNARDAMPGGGTLTIETRNVLVNAATEPGNPDIEPGQYVLLSIADSGHGMDDATKFMAFDPFFTTKPAGQGTGLGLSTVYGVITQSGGHVVLESAPGSGTTLRIYLPRVDASVLAPPPAIEQHGPRGQETVLLVEDEESLRRFLRLALERAGYRVLEAADSSQALAIAARHGRKIQLLLTDVIMPGMSGGQLAEQFLRDWPGTSVLFMSGYARDVVVQHIVHTSGAAFLQKPFTPEVLLTRVRSAIDARPRTGTEAGEAAANRDVGPAS